MGPRGGGKQGTQHTHKRNNNRVCCCASALSSSIRAAVQWMETNAQRVRREEAVPLYSPAPAAVSDERFSAVEELLQDLHAQMTTRDRLLISILDKLSVLSDAPPPAGDSLLATDYYPSNFTARGARSAPAFPRASQRQANFDRERSGFPGSDDGRNVLSFQVPSSPFRASRCTRLVKVPEWQCKHGFFFFFGGHPAGTLLTHPRIRNAFNGHKESGAPPKHKHAHTQIGATPESGYVPWAWKEELAGGRDPVSPAYRVGDSGGHHLQLPLVPRGIPW